MVRAHAALFQLYATWTEDKMRAVGDVCGDVPGGVCQGCLRTSQTYAWSQERGGVRAYYFTMTTARNTTVTVSGTSESEVAEFKIILDTAKAKA
jgi:predicted Fe-S protein YdhL (DUF1289 family)